MLYSVRPAQGASTAKGPRVEIQQGNQQKYDRDPLLGAEFRQGQLTFLKKEKFPAH
jgi:hypothetical protein